MVCMTREMEGDEDKQEAEVEGSNQNVEDDK